MQDLLRKISDSYKEFSAGQKKVGDLFIEQPILLAFSSALEVGRKVNVSESTVIRWTQKLGYKGYTEFQHVVQQKLAQERLEQSNGQSAEPAEKRSYLDSLLDAEIDSIQQLKQSLEEEKLLRMVELVTEADKIYVTSNFFDYGLAHSFASWLDLALGHTEILMQGEVQYYRQLSRLTTGCVVVAFSFPRYTKNVTETVEMARQQGAKVIIITDSPKAPPLQYANLSLYVSVSSNLGIDSYTAVHALLTSVMRFVYAKEHQTVKQNLDRVDLLYSQKNIFH